MKYVIFVALFGAALAMPQRQEPEVTITRSEFENKEDGSFNWASELSDGSKQEQSGFLKQIGDASGISISGSYSFTSPEGTLVELRYIADENGFQPESEFLPTSPPIPEAIQKALEVIYRNAEAQNPEFKRPGSAPAPAARAPAARPRPAQRRH